MKNKLVKTHLLRRMAWAGGLALSLVAIGCGGSKTSETDNVVAASPRPAFGTLNLVVNNASVPTSTTSGSTPAPSAPVTLTHQLFLDTGQNTSYLQQWPQVVQNHQDNQAITLWRYDFIESAASVTASGGTPGQSNWYATMLVRVDDTTSNESLTFWGRGGVFYANAQLLNPSSLFPAESNLPETPANKKATASWIYVRQGNPVALVDPAVVGKLGPYGSMSNTTTVAINVPGLDFPVGGAGLMPTDSTLQTVGNTAALLDIQQAQASASGSGASSSGTGTTINPIITPASTCESARVPATQLVSPVTSQWDMIFGWQPPSMGVTLTHGIMADSSEGGEYTNGALSATGGGFFLTMLPGSAAPAPHTHSLAPAVLWDRRRLRPMFPHGAGRIVSGVLSR